MRQCTITVHNYCSGGSILHIDRGKEPKTHRVKAWCVGGKDGIFAVFKLPDFPGCTCYAQGDDGHWWLAGRHHCHWTPQIVEAFRAHMRDGKRRISKQPPNTRTAK